MTKETSNITGTALAICKALSEKMASDIKVVNIHGMSDLADYFIICSGRT